MEIVIERKATLNRGALIAFVDVTLNGELTIKGCKIMSSNGGKFVGMPSQKNEKDGKYYDHCRFKTRELQDEFSHLVVSAYEGNSGSSSIKKDNKHENAEPSWEE